MPPYPPPTHARTPVEMAIEMIGQWAEKADARLKALENRVAYAIQNGTAGTPAGTFTVALFGKQADFTTALRFFTAAGATLINIGQQSDGTYSSQQYDTAGNLRVVMGQMPASTFGRGGDYALLVANADGTSQELLPMVSSTNSGTASTTGTSYVSSVNLPSVTATFGASGDAWVEASAALGVAAAAGLSQGAELELYIDSGAHTYQGFLQYYIAMSSGTVAPEGAAGCSYRGQLSKLLGTTLAANQTHTFTLRIASLIAGSTAYSSATTLTVQPI